MPSAGRNGRVKVSEDTSIHMTTVYTRKKSSAKESIKRTFNFVIKGLLISSTLVGTVLSTTGFAKATAAEPPVTPTKDEPVATYDWTEEDEFRDEVAMISNLKMATKVLEAAIKRGELDLFIYENIMKRLAAIEAQIIVYGEFYKIEDLMPVLTNTDYILKKAVDDKSSPDLLLKRSESLKALEQLQDRLEISLKERGVDEMLKRGIIIEVSKKEKLRSEVSIASANQHKEINVTIDGTLQTFPQPAVSINGATMVPMRAIFEKLGAEITWNQATKTVTATKGDIEVILTIGNSLAKVNGTPVTLTSKPVSVNGSTMVPLRFVSEALGAEVKWDNATQTAHILSSGVSPQAPAPTPTPQSEQKEELSDHQVVGGIKVLYGRHTYGTKTQEQYDEVMRIVNKAIEERLDSIVIGGRHAEYVDQYLDGDRASNYSKDSIEYRALTIINSHLGSLANAGVPKEDIIKIAKAAMLAQDMIIPAKNVTTGSPNSAYHTLVLGVSDCDAEAHTYSAFLDALGYNTVVIVNPGHANALVQVGDKWYTTANAALRFQDHTQPLREGFKVHTLPTWGENPFKEYAE